MTHLKLATWNVALPVATSRREALRAFTDREQADVWVLTETNDGFTPGHDFSHSSTAGRDGLHKDGHRWVTIWSQHPLDPLFTSDENRTAAVRIKPKSGDPFVVFGTVLPWIGSNWQEYPSADGVAFREALVVQSADWKRLRRYYPEDEFFVLGDFNQDLVKTPPRYYGSLANRTALEEALSDVGLDTLTAADGDPIRRDSPPCACIDHICARADSKWSAEPATRWPDKPKPERWLSDHFGVSVSFRRG